MKNLPPPINALATACPGRGARIAAMGVIAMMLPVMAIAAQWDVDPVRVELSPKQRTATITVRNDSDQPTSIQLEAVAWTQVGGKDVYSPTRDLLVSPPIVTIPPRGEQVIRAALRGTADPTKELAFRINLQELPAQPAPGFTGVQVALRVGMPVFVQPQKGSAVPNMTWNVSRTSDSTLKLGMQNSGNAHVQVSGFSLYAPGSDQSITDTKVSSYVLAGQTGEWLLNSSPTPPSSGDRLRLKASTDAEAVDTVLVLARP